jgi:hypothetical protein
MSISILPFFKGAGERIASPHKFAHAATKAGTTTTKGGSAFHYIIAITMSIQSIVSNYF